MRFALTDDLHTRFLTLDKPCTDGYLKLSFEIELPPDHAYGPDKMQTLLDWWLCSDKWMMTENDAEFLDADENPCDEPKVPVRGYLATALEQPAEARAKLATVFGGHDFDALQVARDQGERAGLHDDELKQAKVNLSSSAQLVITGTSVELSELGAAAADDALQPWNWAGRVRGRLWPSWSPLATPRS